MIKMINNVSYLSEKVVVFVETKCLVFRKNVNFELKYIKTDASVSRQNTQKFSQSQRNTRIVYYESIKRELKTKPI